MFRQIETVQNRYDSSTAEAFRVVQKSGEMVVRTLDPRQFIRLASETVPKINIDSNVSEIIFKSNTFENSDRLLVIYTLQTIYIMKTFFANVFDFLVFSSVIIVHNKTKYKTFSRFLFLSFCFFVQNMERNESIPSLFLCDMAISGLLEVLACRTL